MLREKGRVKVRFPACWDSCYQDYREILTCFQAVQRSFRADELIYDFSTDAVGVVERGQAALIVKVRFPACWDNWRK